MACHNYNETHVTEYFEKSSWWSEVLKVSGSSRQQLWGSESSNCIGSG